MWSRWKATPPGPVVVAAAVVGGGGGRGGDGIDSAHRDPGVPSLDGTEVGGALLAVAGATADAVTFSKSHFLYKKKEIVNIHECMLFTTNK